MRLPALARCRRGAALMLTLMLSFAIAAMALGAIMLASGAQIATSFTAREASLQAAANGGLEIIRDSVNRGIFDSLLPANGYTTLASSAAVTDALGRTLPGITRSLYVGRTGGRTGGAATAGQYGSNFASAVSIISDRRGAVAARRLLMTQESWAKFAVAINNWSGSAAYGCGESVNGPFHSNTSLNLQGGCSSPKILFSGLVSVVGSISNQSSGDYRAGVKTGATAIPWPTPARIALMQQYAQDADAAGGDYDLTAPSFTLAGTTGSLKPTLRIEFLPIDVNGNGQIEWDEGFMRVYYTPIIGGTTIPDSQINYLNARSWLTDIPAGATASSDPNGKSRNCGAVAQLNGTGASRFRTANEVWTGTTAGQLAAVRTLLASGTRRCYLGGDPHLFPVTTGDTLTPDSLVTNTPLASNNFGWWKKRRTGAMAALGTVRSGDAAYLIPLGANPNFKGVIFVRGDVVISGRLRGRVSVFATGNIIMADDLTYQNPPGTRCDAQGDIFGAIATKDVVIENNTVQVPFPVNGVWYGGFDDTNDANYNMFFLAAGDPSGPSSPPSATGNWYAEGVQYPFSGPPVAIPWSGGSVDASLTAQHCGGSSGAANGCVRVTGGLAQGRVDNATYYPTAYGWAEAHSYDPCGAVNPPPYFPTTGRFIESRYYEIDPVWLNAITIPTYFTKLRAQ